MSDGHGLISAGLAPHQQQERGGGRGAEEQHQQDHRHRARGLRHEVAGKLGGGRGDGHLHEAGDAGCGAGDVRADADRTGDRRGQQQAVAEADDDLRQEHRRHLPARQHDVGDDAGEGAHDGQYRAPPDQRIDAEASDEPRNCEIAEHEADRRQEEPEPEFGRAVSQHRHHHVRPAADEAEEGGRAQARTERVADEFRAPRQRGEVGAKRTAFGPGGGEFARFRQRQRRPGEDREAERSGEDEDRFPAEQRVENAPDERREHRHQHHHRSDEPDHRGGAVALVEIADDGAPDGLSGRGAERLRHPRRDQAGDAGDEDRGAAGEARERESDQHHRPAAEAVGERAENQLRDRQAQQIERYGELDAGRIGGELGHHAGDRRHQDVERERAHAAHGDEQCEQADGRAP